MPRSTNSSDCYDGMQRESIRYDELHSFSFEDVRLVLCGRLAQLEEHLGCNEEVVGSIPAPSTTSLAHAGVSLCRHPNTPGDPPLGRLYLSVHARFYISLTLDEAFASSSHCGGGDG